MTPVEQATLHISSVDPIMAKHINAVGPCLLGGSQNRGSRRKSYFEELSRNIVYQQLAGRAAETIWGRFRLLIAGPFVAETVLALSEAEMRSAGLSTNKARAIRDLAEHVADGRVKLRSIRSFENEVVIEQLTKVRGIGRWTAEMFLMFQLGRLDVWPVSDLGVRNGFRLLYQLEELPSVKELDQAGDQYRPYRSVAAWYCWRAADIKLPT